MPRVSSILANSTRNEYVDELLSPDGIQRTGGFSRLLAVNKLVEKARKGQVIGAKDNMALVGILSTQLFMEQFITQFREACIMVSVEQKIRDFIIENFLFGEKDCQLSADDSFMEQGIIDSTGVLELVAFVERTYGIKVKNDELVPDNLDSVNKLIRFIDRKTSRRENADA